MRELIPGKDSYRLHLLGSLDREQSPSGSGYRRYPLPRGTFPHAHVLDRLRRDESARGSATSRRPKYFVDLCCLLERRKSALAASLCVSAFSICSVPRPDRNCREKKSRVTSLRGYKDAPYIPSPFAAC